MKLKSIAFIVIAAIVTSCGGPSSENTEKKSEELDSIQTQAQTQENDSTVELNNGAKWVVVPDMMKFIRNMENDVLNFSKISHTDISDYSKLGMSLKQNIDSLTSNCTMEGKPHDELHKWLLPFIDLVDEFNTSTELEKAKNEYVMIVESFKTFNIYFE